MLRHPAFFVKALMKTHLSLRTSILFLIFIVLGINYPVLFAPLNSVDDIDMYGYFLNADGLTLRDIFTPSGGQYYRPLLALTFYLDQKLWGLEQSFMHLDNVLFHLVNVLLIFAIAHKLWTLYEGRDSLAPLAVALLFALHPLNVESVAWVSGRTDLIAGIFIFLAVYLMFFVDKRPLPLGYSIAVAGSILLACLAKETAVFFLPAAFIFPFFSLNKNSDTPKVAASVRNGWLHCLVLLASGIGYVLVRTGAFSTSDEGVATIAASLGGGEKVGLLENGRLIVKAAGFYLKKLFLPFPLNFGIIHVSDFYILLGFLLVPLCIWWLYRRDLPSYFFVCSVSVGISAMMIPVLRMTWTPIAERYMYLPSAFFLLATTLLVDRRIALYPRKNIVIVCVVAICVVAAYGTASRNLVWQDNLTLYQDTVRKSPDFIPAQNELANALVGHGRLDEARAILNSMELSDDLNNVQIGHVNRAMMLTEQGDFEGARCFLKKVLEKPGRHKVMILGKLIKVYDKELMVVGKDSGKLLSDMAPLLEQLRTLTGDPFYSYRLGLVYLQLHDNAKARSAFLDAAKRAPVNAHYRDAARRLAEKFDDCVQNEETW